MTIWKDIPGYEGLYKVSNDGQILSCARIVHHPNNRFAKKQSYPNKVMKPRINKWGYFTIKLSKDDNRKDWLVHRLVAMAFIEPVEGKNYIDHKDGNKRNNEVSNLEWVTIAENNQRAYDKGLKSRFHKGQFLKGVCGELQYILRR